MPWHLKKLNLWQLYLQIHTLYNISNGYGNYFEKRYYDGHQYEFCPATHSWPYQWYLGLKEWQLWRKAIIKFIPNINTSIYLHKLVKWTDNHWANCTWFYHQELRSLFTKNTTGKLWKKYNQLHPQWGLEENRTFFTFHVLAFLIPPTLMRANTI